MLHDDSAECYLCDERVALRDEATLANDEGPRFTIILQGEFLRARGGRQKPPNSVVIILGKE
jgi:hypothetical protein